MSGTVVDSAGRPVGDATVWVVDRSFDEPNEPRDQTRTDAKGRFAFEDSVIEGVFDGRNRQRYVWARDARNRLGWSGRLERADAASLRIELREVADARGRVIDGSGNPIAGARVEIKGLGSKGLRENRGQVYVQLPSGVVDASDFAAETTADGKIVMAVRNIGKGRVAAFTGKRFLWGCTVQTSVQYDVGNQAFVRRMLAWLTEGLPPRKSMDSLVDLRLPDIELKGRRTSIRTTEVLRERAQHTLDQFDRVYDVLYDYFKVPAYSKLRINALAGAGGGGRAGDEIGIAVLASDDGIKSLLLWEMTNGWGPPIPRSWGEMWAVHAGQILRGRLAIGSPADQILTRHRERQAVIDVDPRLNKLDLADTGDEKTHRQVLSKASRVMEQLERSYPGFIARLCRIHRAREGWTEQMSMQDFVSLCSLAAGTDLHAYFRDLGTTVAPREIDFAQARELLAKYEREHPAESRLPRRSED